MSTTSGEGPISGVRAPRVPRGDTAADPLRGSASPTDGDGGLACHHHRAIVSSRAALGVRRATQAGSGQLAAPFELLGAEAEPAQGRLDDLDDDLGLSLGELRLLGRLERALEPHPEPLGHRGVEENVEELSAPRRGSAGCGRYELGGVALGRGPGGGGSGSAQTRRSSAC